jgi:hypothetical protein
VVNLPLPNCVYGKTRPKDFRFLIGKSFLKKSQQSPLRLPLGSVENDDASISMGDGMIDLNHFSNWWIKSCSPAV